MNTSALERIEEDINRLSLSEQIWLIERLAHRLRNTLQQEDSLEDELAMMAHDPEIQRELHQIENEFNSTLADGLDTEV
jgi:hypothetical protein